MKKSLLLIACLLFIPLASYGQGVTTSAMKGTIFDEDGETLPGATVVAVHEPSGSEYGTSTNARGNYFLPNMRVGGPYTIRVSFVGYEPVTREDIILNLGDTFILDVTLRQATAELGELQVVAQGGVFDINKTGVSTNLNEQAIENNITVGRDIADFTRNIPSAYIANNDDDGPAVSIAGQNNRYNSIFIDGAVSNDVFGLSAQGTNGGQTGATPISIDAIEQFQINLSPFDVTQGGFTGGAINAVTRSGSNTFTGSAYFFQRSETLAGKTPLGLQNVTGASAERLPDFSNNRYGIRLGGPIIEDKLFFFVNAEILRSETPRPITGNYVGDVGIGGVEDLRQFLISEVGYDPGGFGDKNSVLDSDKVLAKIDWNISRQHKLTARYSLNDSENIDAFDSDFNSINFSGRNEVFPNTTHTAALELTSTFGQNMSNKLIFGYTDVKDDRGVNGEPFPTVNIDDGRGGIFLGNEPFSTANILEQQIFTITNDFNIFAGNHTITIGTHNEFYDIANLFIPYNYGWYFYDSVEDFRQAVRAANDPTIDTPLVFTLRGFSIVGDNPLDPNNVGDASNNIGAFNAYQLGFYVQDEWQATNNLRLTGGLRFDIPEVTTDPRFAPDVFSTTLPELIRFHDLNGARPGQTPDPQIYVSPRFGFNWDVFGNSTTQLRGGAGVFLGRVPFVWPGGMFLNNGANTGILSRFGANPFRPDVGNGLTQADFGGSLDTLVPSGRLEMFEEDFKYPRVFRTSLGVDQDLGNGYILTLEGQYTNTLNNILVTNINLLPPNEVMDGPDNRPIYAYDITSRNELDGGGSLIDGRYENIHRVGTTNKGYTYNFTASLQKQFGRSLFANVAYSYGDAFAVNDGTSSQINSLWDGVEHVYGANNIGLSRSDFSLGHRFIVSLNYRKEFFDNLATSISLFWEGVSGRPFSYVISDSDAMIGEAGDPNSLLYVPNSAFELTWTGTPEEQAAQAAAFERFISSSDYLNSRRGDYVERNGSRAPFESIIDLKIQQELFGNVFNRQQKLTLTLDIFNFTNLIGQIFDVELGQRYATGSQIRPIEFEGYTDPQNGDFTPTYSFNLPDTFTSEEDIFENNLQDFGTYSSRWQMQFGVRYSF
jgi:outer membrane receptor protein involved in Fe transport